MAFTQHLNSILFFLKGRILPVFFLIIVFFNFHLYSQNNKTIEFYDAFVYTEAKTRFSENTNFPNKANEIFQQLELKMKVNLNEMLYIYSMFKTEYAQFHWKRDDRQFFLNSLGVEYNKQQKSKNKPKISMKMGSLYLNYSPYLLKNYPWESDIFRGFEFNFELKGFGFNLERTFTFQSFVANNGVNVDEGSLADAVPTINKDNDRDYSTIKLGYKNADQTEETTRPTWWYGVKTRYKTAGYRFSDIDAFIAYLHEEYQNTWKKYSYSQVYNNQFIFADSTFSILRYIDVNGGYGKGYSMIRNYSISSNKYGKDKDLYNKPAITNISAEAVKTSITIPAIMGEKIKIYKTSIQAVYDKLDENYRPAYLDNKYQIRRSCDPDLNLYSGRKGVFLIARQFFLPGTSIGYGYKEHKFKFNEMVPFLEKGTAIEHQIRAEEDYLKYFKIKFVYQIQKARNAVFADNVKKMNTFFLSIKSDVLNNLGLEFEYAKNLDYYKGLDRMSVKMLIWGF